MPKGRLYGLTLLARERKDIRLVAHIVGKLLHRALEFLHRALEFLRRALEFLRHALCFFEGMVNLQKTLMERLESKLLRSFHERFLSLVCISGG